MADCALQGMFLQSGPPWGRFCKSLVPLLLGPEQRLWGGVYTPEHRLPVDGDGGPAAATLLYAF